MLATYALVAVTVQPPLRDVEKRTFKTDHLIPSHGCSLHASIQTSGGCVPPLRRRPRGGMPTATTRPRGPRAENARPPPQGAARVSPTHCAAATLRPLHASPPPKLSPTTCYPAHPSASAHRAPPREALVTPTLKGAGRQPANVPEERGPLMSLAQSHFFVWSPKGPRACATHPLPRHGRSWREKQSPWERRLGLGRDRELTG